MSSRPEERRGWRVGHRGRDQMYYEELRDGTWERIEIDGEMLMGRAHHVIYFASPERWQRYPAWARNRRDEIIARITSEFREPDYEYSGREPGGSDGGSTAAGIAPADPPGASSPAPRPLDTSDRRPAARRAGPEASGLRALRLAVVLLFAIAAFMAWVVTRSVTRGETWYPNTRPSLRRTVARQTGPAMFWVSVGLYAAVGVGTCTLGVLGARAARRMVR